MAANGLGTALSAAQQKALDWLLPNDAERLRYKRSEAQAADADIRDFVIFDTEAQCNPRNLFDTLRWGGQILLVGPSQESVAACRSHFAGQKEWHCEQPDTLPEPLPLDDAHGVCHFATVRKVLLDPPWRLTARHSYEVRLVPPDPPSLTESVANQPLGHGSEGWFVEKRIPTIDEAVSRLRQTHPTLAHDKAHHLAKRLVNTVFPLLLTREASFLKRLSRRMPQAFEHRTPKLLSMDTNPRGLVTAIRMTWLRQGGPTLAHLEFARQAADILAATHHHAQLMHLDLRLPNCVITEYGVGLIDFGSSVMIGEDLTANRAVNSVVREMLLASEITADLKRHRKKDLISNPIFDDLPHPPDPNYDLFALATQMTRPHDLPDFRGLVTFDRKSDQAATLSRLRRHVLRKPTHGNRTYTCLNDLIAVLGQPGDPSPPVLEEVADAVGP
ncbi:MAG: hypothetical protein V3V20_08080 [Algisphaera sp.]